MKKFALTSLFAALTVSTSAMAADGEVQFTGTIVNTTCAITIGDTTGGAAGEVKLGPVPAGALGQAGAIGGGGTFSLSVDASDPACNITGKKATVTFLGLTGVDGPSGQWLSLEKSAGYAKNVAIQIRDRTGEVKMSEPSAEYMDLTEPMRFTANYIATGVAEPGTANGKASFTVSIQ
ncbi:fimbrial protein [Pseudomonas sp. UBA4194]|jgi:major type 1 subunit fimbrin (pilin)|uniref:fimbrial protein n=1 Tax=Pseudomonas sp. UBA4194 TaxID=1947317 RepID=UPI0025DF2637|nr:fimbrial protein [Pseudomonas sp. UBA4194]